MHGLVNRAIQRFLNETYGSSLWTEVAKDCGVNPEGFEAMLHYDDALTTELLTVAARALGRSREAMLEDIGTWLVSSQTGQPLRRLLRFGGVGFTDFLHSLEDLPERGRLAISDLDLPTLRLRETRSGDYELLCDGPPGFGHILVGILRTMADDYGALVLLDHAGIGAGGETIIIQLKAADFSAGRRFELAGEG